MYVMSTCILVHGTETTLPRSALTFEEAIARKLSQIRLSFWDGQTSHGSLNKGSRPFYCQLQIGLNKTLR